MTPSPFIATYKQYTIDLDAVAAWLAKTAAICGYPMDKCTTQAPTEQKVERKAVQKSGRLKGNARKLAQQASSENSSDSQNRDMKPEVLPQRPKYLVAMEWLVPLAECIANSTQTCIEMPASFLSALDRAVRVRKTYFIWWNGISKKHGGKTDGTEQAIQSHDSIVGILERVREVLQPRMPPGLFEDLLAQPVEQTPTSVDLKNPENDQLVYSLQIPHVGRAKETFLGNEPITAHQMPSSTLQVEYRLDPILNLNENDFACHCLFHDFNVIRVYIQQVWESYKQGVTDLVAASITTNTAIEIARGIQLDFVKIFENFLDFDYFFHSMYVVACENANHDPALRARPDDEVNFEAYEQFEPKLYPSFIILTLFSVGLKIGIPRSYADSFGSYDPKRIREWISPKEKFRQDQALFLEVFLDFYFVAHGHSQIPFVDEMTRGICQMIKTNFVTPWLALATQVYLDIHHILREKVSDGFHDLVKSARYVEKNIQHILAFQMNLRLDARPKSNDEILFWILDVIKSWVNLDWLQNLRMRVGETHGILETPAKSFSFLKNHPWQCGLLLYYFKASAQEASIRFVNALGSIFSTAHLYHALRQGGLLTNVWPDMDLASLIHNTEGSFFKPTADYCEQFSLAMKYSAKNPAKNRMNDGSLAAKSGPTKLSQLAPVCSMFRNRFFGHETCVNLSPDQVNTILNVADSIEAWKILKFTTKTNPTTNVRSRNPIVQFLNALLVATQSETLELTFDHFRLHIFCWTLLRKLRDALYDDLIELHGRGCLDKNQEDQLPDIVGYILMTAVSATATATDTAAEKQKLAGTNTGTSSSTPASRKGKQKDVVKNRLLVKAAKVMNRMLKPAGAGQSQWDALKELGVQLPASLDGEEKEAKLKNKKR